MRVEDDGCAEAQTDRQSGELVHQHDVCRGFPEAPEDFAVPRMLPVRRVEPVREQTSDTDPALKQSERRRRDVDELDPFLRGRSQARRYDLVPGEQRTDLPVDPRVGREVAERDDENPGQRRRVRPSSADCSPLCDRAIDDIESLAYCLGTAVGSKHVHRIWRDPDGVIQDLGQAASLRALTSRGDTTLAPSGPIKLRAPCRSRDDRRNACRHGLDRGDAEGVGKGRHRERVSLPKQISDLLPRAGSDEHYRQPIGLLLERSPFGPFTHDREDNIAMVADK